MKGKNILRLVSSLLILIGILTSCSSSRKINKDYIYFKDGPDSVIYQKKETIIQPNDLLNIQVYSKTINQEQAAIFNIPATANNLIQGYQVNSDGNIEMPVIGSIQAAGFTKDQLQATLVRMLNDFVKDPSVIVRFIKFNVNVLGEVRVPGIKNFSVDQVTIIDAISAAGDLTDYGKRENIMVIRERGDKKISYIVDLRKKSVFESPAYILQPNDIVYVSPNNYKLRSLSINPDNQRRTTLFLTISSTLISLASLLLYFFR